MHRRLCALIVVVGAGFWLAGCASSNTKPGSDLQKPAAKPALLREADSAGVIDDFEQAQQTQQTWKVEAWANPATLTAEKGTLKIELQPGKADKVAISRQANIFIKDPSRIMLDVDNQAGNDISVAIALATGTVPTYFECPPVKIKPGLARKVEFDLKSDRFKAASTQWMPNAKISEINAIRLIYVVIYTPGKGTVYLDNLRAAVN